MGRRTLLVIAPLLAVLLVPMTADATGCSHDNYGDDQFWTDQYWMGWDYYDSSPYCDTSGTYLYAVQRVNLVVVSFPSSGVDGIYGSGTQSDVRKFQFLQSITDDGLVGTTTWGRYDNYLSAATCYPTGECLWKIPVYSSAWIFRDFGACCNWETQKPGLTGWTAFGRYGPP